MAEITVLNSKFEASGTIDTSVGLAPENIHVATVHQVVKATLAGRRQGTASTKTRGLVRGGGAKPFNQKGTGRARQGSNRSPLNVGGGTTFGPTPRDYTQKINKKVVNKAIQSVLADKYQAGKLTVVEKIESNGKTREMYKLLTGKSLYPALIVTEMREDLALRAAKNLQYASGLPVDGFSIYEVVKYENLVIEKTALEKLLSRIS